MSGTTKGGGGGGGVKEVPLPPAPVGSDPDEDEPETAANKAKRANASRSLHTCKEKEASAGLKGPLRLLPGTWGNTPNLEGRGWNSIALPFKGAPFNYRVLVNQYNERLTFRTVDQNVPNRGIEVPGLGPNRNDPDGERDPDQFVIALDYEQTIKQVAVDDFPSSKKDDGTEDEEKNAKRRGAIGNTIHHEVGLFLNMKDEKTKTPQGKINVARLGTIPHGQSVLALGVSRVIKGDDLASFRVPNTDGTPQGTPGDIGVSVDPAKPTYLDPYKHYHEHKFKDVFDPSHPEELLQLTNGDNSEIERIIELPLDTKVESAGISNIPFIVKQADAASMRSTFWIQVMKAKHPKGHPRAGKNVLRLQYLQVIMLDFFAPRRDGLPGKVRWPHVSINTLEKVSDCDVEFEIKDTPPAPGRGEGGEK